MADKALRGNRLTQRKMAEAGPKKIGPKKVGKGYRVVGDPKSPVAKSRVIDRMKEEAKALGGSFFTAAEMEAKIKKKKDPRGTGEISLRKKIYGGDPRKGK